MQRETYVAQSFAEHSPEMLVEAQKRSIDFVFLFQHRSIDSTGISIIGAEEFRCVNLGRSSSHPLRRRKQRTMRDRIDIQRYSEALIVIQSLHYAD